MTGMHTNNEELGGEKMGLGWDDESRTKTTVMSALSTQIF